MPFSDPLADGPVIQRASERALAAGMTLRGVLELVGEVRNEDRHADRAVHLRQSGACGWIRMRFAESAREAGVDGVLILDYPVEEAEPLRTPLVAAGLDPIFLISPTTTRRADPAVVGAGRRVSLRDLAAGRHRRARQRWQRMPARWWTRVGQHARCRWRSASGSRGPNMSPTPAATPMPRWSAARSST